MARDSGHDHVLVAIEAGSDQQEEIGVEAIGDDVYRVVVPPLFTFGLAVGDEFRIDARTHRPDVLRRSGNLLVWLFHDRAPQERIAATVEEVEALGGTYEGSAREGKVLLFTIPVSATFPAVERVFDGFVADHPTAEWLFGNVYADDGKTPLGWWE